MEREKLADLVVKFTEAFNRDDLDGVMSFMADDAVYDEFTGAINRGAAAIRAAFVPQFRGDYGKIRFNTELPLQRVAVALFEGFTVLDVYGPVQAFASCRIVQPDGKRRPLFEIFS